MQIRERCLYYNKIINQALRNIQFSLENPYFIDNIRNKNKITSLQLI